MAREWSLLFCLPAVRSRNDDYYACWLVANLHKHIDWFGQEGLHNICRHRIVRTYYLLLAAVGKSRRASGVHLVCRFLLMKEQTNLTPLDFLKWENTQRYTSVDHHFRTQSIWRVRLETISKKKKINPAHLKQIRHTIIAWLNRIEAWKKGESKWNYHRTPFAGLVTPIPFPLNSAVHNCTEWRAISALVPPPSTSTDQVLTD